MIKTPTATISEAAEVLNVSEEFVRELVASTQLAAVPVAGEVRINGDAVAAFKRKRDSGRRDGLRELTRMTEDFGGYDAERGK